MAATESTATEAPATATETPAEGADNAAGAPKKEFRKAILAKVEAKLSEAQTAENKAQAGIEGEDKGEGEGDKPAKDPKKPDAKAKDPKAKDAPAGEDKELTKEWRDLRRAKSKFASKEATLVERESRVKSFESKLQAEAEEFEKDPLAWLRKRGKNPKEVLLRIAKEEGEDPKEKVLREVTTKLGDVEKKLTEREKQEQERQQAERAQQAQKKIESDLLEAYEGTDAGEEYPHLATAHEPAEVASLARALVLRYYSDTEASTGKGVVLSPEQAFHRLEAVLRQRAETEAKKAKGKAPKSGTPDRARTAAKGGAETPEDDDENPRRPADVTNRETRLRTAAPAGEAKDALRKRLVRMAAERIIP